jgi:hypothetical protein
MPDASIPDLTASRLAATESLDVILVGLRHREKSKAERQKRKWGSVPRSRVSAIGYQVQVLRFGCGHIHPALDSALYSY